MDEYNPCKSLFYLDIKINKECDSLKLNATLYMQLVGSLIYLTHTLSDILFVGNLISKFM